ncbi:MAG: hypothetical protein QG632_912 [Candidatus Dependentiae bacterium]|jgi:hypothetical protein|nr:hypothetical protein [Candidatus Dependentiae bacterium]
MTDQVISFSPAALQRRLIISAITVSVACVVMSLFFLGVWFAPNLQRILITILWITLPLLWVLGAVLESMRQSKTKYILTKDALLKEKKGWFGSTTSQLYRYDTINSVNSKSRAKGSFGSVELIFEENNSLYLSGIANPDDLAREIKRRAADARSSIRVDNLHS